MSWSTIRAYELHHCFPTPNTRPEVHGEEALGHTPTCPSCGAVDHRAKGGNLDQIPPNRRERYWSENVTWNITEYDRRYAFDSPQLIFRGSIVESGFMGRVRWTVEEKLRIVELTLEPGASVARVVAQAEGVNANQVFQWRRAYREDTLATGGASTALHPVVIEAETGSMSELVSEPEATPSEAGTTQPFGAIHIELPGRAAISVEHGADRALLRTILESLQR